MNDLVKQYDARPRYYDMEGNPIADTLTWAMMFESDDRQIGRTEYLHPPLVLIKRYTWWLARCVWKYVMTWERMPKRAAGRILISTVWLGIDHNFMMEGPPLIFETMVFDGNFGDRYCERYATKDEALAGHAKAVAWVKAGMRDA